MIALFIMLCALALIVSGMLLPATLLPLTITMVTVGVIAFFVSCIILIQNGGN